MSKRCLYCYQEVNAAEKDFHARCSKKVFGQPIPPELPYSEDQMSELGEKVIKSHVAVTGVQPKLSVGIEKNPDQNAPDRITIVGVFGDYILKPPTTHYPNLPELEDLTMHLASIAGIATVPHSLIRLKTGQLAYITKRIDRHKKQKLHMEDMCQLTERLTEHKYKGSYEQIAKAVLKYSMNPGLDIINFFEQVVFCFLTGNNDMHLKNFSLIKDPKLGYNLSPAYDMVAAALVAEGDTEELALNLNGKKNKLKRKDFDAAMAQLDGRIIANIFSKFQKSLPKWESFIDVSFLSAEMRERYKELISAKAKQLEL